MHPQLLRLTDIGFLPVGHWLPDGDGMFADLDSHARSRDVLYAFVVDGQPKYIGKTVRELRNRMSMYRNAGQRQSTNIRNKRLILEAMAAGSVVEIYALPDNGLLHYGGFHINMAAGLEDSLIREINPPWNGGLKEDKDGGLQQLETAEIEAESPDQSEVEEAHALETGDLQVLKAKEPRKRYFMIIADRLRQQEGSEFVATFDEIETWLGEPLPLRAREEHQWWSSGRAMWNESGWKLSPLFPQASIRFRRVRLEAGDVLVTDRVTSRLSSATP